MTLKVLALVTDAFGGRGGIAQYNRDFLSALVSSGYRVTTIPRHAPDPVQMPSGIIQIRARAGRIAYSLVALYEAWRSRPDIVFCGHIFMAPLAWLAAKLAGARLVMQMHGIEAWPRPSRVIRGACESAALILNVSRYTRARVLDWAAIAPERALVLPNTVDECFTPGDASALRGEWRLEGKRILLTVGRMSASERYKGHDRVILTLPKLLEAGHDVIYIVAGEGDDRHRLEQLATGAGLAERVLFVGPLERERLINAYRLADLFIMPSTREGFGIVFLEAMACGTPALGLAVAGARDALADGALGFITDEERLSQSIIDILNNLAPDRVELSQKSLQAFGSGRYRRSVSNIAATLEHTA